MNRKPGDWNCRSCSHLNFSRRDSCQRCGDTRSISGGDVGYGSGPSFGRNGGPSFGFTSGSDVRPGDWYCTCGTHNFASRSNCFRCSAFKDDAFDGSDHMVRPPHPRPGGGAGGVGGGGYGFGSGGGGARSGWKSGDWICSRPGCNEHNFASRMECFRCNAPRESGTQV